MDSADHALSCDDVRRRFDTLAGTDDVDVDGPLLVLQLKLSCDSDSSIRRIRLCARCGVAAVVLVGDGNKQCASSARFGNIRLAKL